MRKRITSLLLTLAMLCSLLPAMGVTASAAEPEWKIVNTYDELEAALSNQNPPDNIKLGADIDTEALHSSMGIITSLEVKGSKKLDLNGHTLRMYSAKTAMSDMITIEYGDLTVLDSSSGQKGTILGSTYKDSCYLINVRTNGQFTLNSGTLKVDAGSLSGKPWWKRVIYCYAGGTVTINGGTLHVAPETYENEKNSYGEYFEQGYADLLNGYCGYTLMAADSCKVTINGGTFEGPVRLDAGGSKWNKNEPRVTITNGTFEKKVMLNGAGDGTRPLTVISGGKFLDYVQAWAAASFDEKNPFTASEVTVNGGEFHDTFWIRPTFPSSDIVSGGARRGYHLSARLMSATIYKCITADPDIIDLYKVYVAGKQDNSQKTVNDIYNLASEVLDRSAVQNNNGCFSPLDTASYRQMFSYRNTGKPETEGYLFELKALGDTPTKIIPNAWGVMESVTLDGKKINYAKDWKGAVEEMDNSTAHTIKFTWKSLADELKNAGYSYRTKCEHYISGASGVQQTENIDAKKTSHTVTIKKGADPKVYSFDLQLNLQKDGDTVGIYTNDHNIVKLVVNEAPDTFISTVSFNLAKTEVGKPGELSFEATDVNGKPVAINPDVTWKPDKIVEGNNNHVSFTIPAPKGYTFSGTDGKTTALKFGGVDVIGYVDNTGALNFSFPLEVPHQHKVDHVSYNAKYHWDVCSCEQKIMNTSEPHNMGAWVEGATLSSGGVVYNRSCTSGCGYTETTIDYSGVKHVTSLVLNMKNYPMDSMKPHNFVYQEGDASVEDTEIPGQSFYKLTHRDSTIKYPSFSIATGNEKVELSATNPEAYEDPAENPDFAKWTTATGTLWLRPDTEYSDYEKEFKTGAKYKAHLTLDAKDGYAFYEDFKTNQDNFKLYIDMEGITIENYGVRRWYYFSNEPSYDDANVPVGWGWYTQAPADNSAGASRVQIVFIITARNEGDLNITLPELKAGDDLKKKWAGFEGTPNFGTDDFVKDCYRSETMAWRSGPSRVIHSGTVTGASVTAQAGQTYTLEIPAVNENVLAHITIKNPTAATKIVEMPSGAIIVTYTLPAAADDKTVNGAAVSITPPAYGVAPNTAATVAGTAHCTASAVTWNPADAAFGEKAYTATVTLTAKTDYTFANNAVFTINGHMADVTKNTDGSVTLRYTFPALTGPHTHTYGGNWIFATPDTHIRYCTANDGSYEEVPHSITSWTDNGDGTHTGTCTDCGYVKTESHNWQWVVDTPATSTTAGKKHEQCTKCTATCNANTEIPATGGGSSSGGGGGGGAGGAGVTTYAITVQNSKNGAVTASHKSAAKDTVVTLTVTPDKGYVLDTLTVLDSKDKAVKLTEKNGKYTFTMPAGKVTVSAAFKAAAPASENPFTDVPSGAYYEDAVIWAVKKDITSGTSATTFDPDGSCTRAQAVTFLWRAAGSPEPKSAAMPFTDVPAGSYFEKAVLWAVENGITKGTSDTTFGPDASCTRAQIVTFLWRANGSPAVSGNSAFTDVAADAYYAAAVAWAEKNGVTGGIGNGLFGSGNTCTRAQIVTFLYRAMK